jgi:hypothetical protein
MHLDQRTLRPRNRGCPQSRDQSMRLSRLTIISLTLFMLTTGCLHHQEQGMSQYVTVTPDEKHARQAEILKRQAGIGLFQKYLFVAKNPEAPPTEVENAMRKLCRMRVIERPEFWVAIVNNPAYGVDERRDALVALFRRHFPPGTRLNRFPKLLGTSDWYSDRNLIKVTTASHLPLNNRGKCVYMYQPNLMRSGDAKRYGQNGAVYFSLSKYISEDELVLALTGRREDEGIRIVELSAHPGPLLHP